ncbi:hypothetical protein M2347_001544 [Chryseobacterium sp. H1D6B]|uniref:hypothetical protein n=1 Tax=Chryseobacterium sp. H1D6B TaxID=2940588 RepID=UPI0015C9233F|nr:hypothetical protein [Chryseobacterium sp. H1D6B]MDH6251817.1 hypothetical protein [Chryseobacterium sp. H1D6B]
MKKNFTLFFFLSFLFCFCQKVELKNIIDSSQLFKGEIAGLPITMQLHYTGIVDCSRYQHFVDGWYYYNKHEKKIPLTGIYDSGNLYLFNFGDKHKQSAKLFKDKITSPRLIERVDSIAKRFTPKEILDFENGNVKEISGNLYLGSKRNPAKLFTGNPMIYRYNDYLTLPDNKKINTYDFIDRYGGNKLLSYESDNTGNRVLLYFDHTSNFNACGMCGASEGEKGYRVLYFTKDWNYKKYEEFLIESCLENIYDTTKIKTNDSNILKFKISKGDNAPSYILTVNKKNASVLKSK